MGRSSLTGVRAAWLSLGIACFLVAPLNAQDRDPSQTAVSEPTYADLADLADSANLAVRVKVRRQAEVEPARAPGLTAGFVRLYVEAETVSLLAGDAPLGQSLRYLVDLPRDSKGRAPKIKKQEFLVFAQPVTGRPGELRLVDPHAQLGWSEALERRVRPILAALHAKDAPPPVTGVRDALSVAGNLAGESETQVFLTTENDRPLSFTVIRRPNMAPVWGVSQSEIVDQSASVPARNTVTWYRLACFLPRRLPREAILTSEAAERQRAQADYDLVISQLGPCERNRS